ncbi:MAG: OadG family protein [Eubacterium sp.]|nr:OadG family protein [Eubacterium sp.]
MKVFNRLRYLLCIALVLVGVSLVSMPVNAEEVYADGGNVDLGQMQQQEEKTYMKGRLKESDVNQHVTQSAQVFAMLFECSEAEYAEVEKQIQNMNGYEGVLDTFQELKSKEMGKVLFKDKEQGLIDTKNIEVLERDDEIANIVYDLPLEKGTVTIELELACYEHIGTVQNNVSIVDRKDVKKEKKNNKKPTLAENMKQAGANTLMGMGTVFAVLIFMSLIISCFKLIPVISEKLSKKETKKVKTNDSIPQETKQVTEEVTDTVSDTELIAVIAAAIAASEQKSTDSFVVRSIKRR